MKIRILGSGGCTITPKPLCSCAVCREARAKGPPFSRTGPAIFIHDADWLIDTPAEIAWQLNRAGIRRLENLTFTHLDPDHVEGMRVVEQIALDYRTWRGDPEKTIRLVLPEALCERLPELRTIYGPAFDFYRKSGFITMTCFRDSIELGAFTLTAVEVSGKGAPAFVLVFDAHGRRMIYAPCDIRPFPEHRPEIRDADLLIIQPGMFEDGLKFGFRFPGDHISRRTLYTFEETLELGRRIRARRLLFTHLEEHWQRSRDDYDRIERRIPGIQFAWDGMELTL